MNTLALVKELKDKEQDFEWYPTTKEMIESITDSLKKPFASDPVITSYRNNIGYNTNSVLDCGAGDGRVLKAFSKALNDSATLYAIENSSILLSKLDSSITPIGTDFNQQSLLDKHADICFSNPPYSEYESWCNKIIREFTGNYIYLVIPSRWKKSKIIDGALASRGITKDKTKIIYSGDFTNADREARAKIDIILISLTRAKSSLSSWIDSTFKQEKSDSKQKTEEELSDTVENQLVSGRNVIDVLVEIYGSEQKKLKDQYDSVFSLDADILKTLKIDKNQLVSLFSTSIKNLKIKFWRELFKNYEPITRTLTSKTRDGLLADIIYKVDFNNENVYMVTGWVIKRASSYYDEQIEYLFTNLANDNYIKEYKSNQKFFDKEEMGFYRSKVSTESRFFLLNRIIYNGWSCFAEYGSYYGGLTDHAFHFIDDILILGRLFGFESGNLLTNTVLFEPGKNVDLWSSYKGNRTIILSAKMHLNGNIHLKFHPDFITKLNIAMGRILGWVKSKKEVQEEMGVSSELADVFNEPLMKIGSTQLLLSQEEKEEIEEPEQKEQKEKPKRKNKNNAIPKTDIEQLKMEFAL